MYVAPCLPRRVLNLFTLAVFASHMFEGLQHRGEYYSILIDAFKYCKPYISLSLGILGVGSVTVIQLETDQIQLNFLYCQLRTRCLSLKYSL